MLLVTLYISFKDYETWTKIDKDIVKLNGNFTSYFTQNSFIHYYNTRGKSNLHRTHIQTAVGKRALTFKGSALWNKLPEHLKTIQSTSSFKNRIKDYLIKQYTN